MQILHFRDCFKKHYNYLLHLTLQNKTTEFSTLKSSTSENCFKELSEILEAYSSLSDKISTGDYGKTAQCWIRHINMVILYQIFSVNIRS